ncbi:dopamine beta-hydroxylase [Polypterus senegalus]|uniref:dopamine beta-hydroxylase n=1 Tax=Polypterus senegalus TaxID=55291 RepID=UPI001966114F|nr:dopamine beta-hydroxylase [Polypterus senegalus]
MHGAAKRSCSPNYRLREVLSVYFTMLALIVVILVVSFHGASPREEDFPYHILLDPEGKLELSWNVSYPKQEVCFQLLVKEMHFGLVFGMSDRGDFENADLVVLWSDGYKSYFGDAWSDGYGHVQPDRQQDYQLLEAHKSSEGFYLTFKRPFNTCDVHDYQIEDGTVHLIYGILAKPVKSLMMLNLSLSGTGIQRVQLLKPNISVPKLPYNVMTMEVRSPSVTIPGQETTYWCYITELPKNMPKHHIVMYEAVITPGNEALVHHMEVFQCAPQFDSMPHYNGPCDSKMKPQRLNYCRHVLAAWAMGAKAFYYPEEAGLAFGGPSSSRFLRLEVHYHNPLLIKDRVDSSGIRLYYTSHLRKYDGGIMELGLVYTPVMAIPPQEENFELTGYCTAKCTETALPQGGMHIFASQLHTHLTGIAVRTVIVRENQEVEIINVDNHFSAHFQEIRMLNKVVTVLPGDTILTTCKYNTMDREKATVGGFGIMEEMCVNYVHYYPHTELELCKSAVDNGYLQKYFAFINRLHDDEMCHCPRASVTEQFAAVSWDSFSKQVLRALYDTAPISMHCNQSSAIRFPGDWERQHLPQVTSALLKDQKKCKTIMEPENQSASALELQTHFVPRFTEKDT